MAADDAADDEESDADDCDVVGDEALEGDAVLDDDAVLDCVALVGATVVAADVLGTAAEALAEVLGAVVDGDADADVVEDELVLGVAVGEDPLGVAVGVAVEVVGEADVLLGADVVDAADGADALVGVDVDVDALGDELEAALVVVEAVAVAEFELDDGVTAC